MELTDLLPSRQRGCNLERKVGLLIISPAVTWNVPVGENIFAGVMIYMLEAEGINVEFNVTFLDISYYSFLLM